MLTGGESMRRQGSKSFVREHRGKRDQKARDNGVRQAQQGYGAGRGRREQRRTPQPRRGSHVDRMRAREGAPMPPIPQASRSPFHK